MAEITITKENFEEEVLKSPIPVLVDFWASWCGQCRMLSPIIGEIAAKYAGRIKVGKVNTDDQPELSMAYRINAIPAVMLFKDGQVADSFVGYMPQENVEEFVNNWV
ncbi:MAG: thioredoxin [Firmicutes bacterium]|nr:thioredoxin [Bacillota bacterium]